jgi:anionic cell wall polymer biosynthesis LytR-Cps2A-Psr (LCP) family protein
MHIRWLTGFDIDYYAVTSVDVFVDVIDAIGGVWFDVPEEMRYGDYEYYDSFYIDLDPGYQLLDGYQAMGLCRYRSSYFNGDIDRVEIQHSFLKAVLKQFFNIRNIPNAAKAIKIAVDGTNTNLSAANIAWFLGQLFRCREEDISFYTAPGTACMLQGYSYYVLDLYGWLSLLNEHLNPYESSITPDMLNIVYKEYDSFNSTGELQGAYFFETED